MFKRRFLLMAVLALLASTLLASDTFAQDSLLISYQGRLTDDVGNPITDTPSIVFTIYDGGGSTKWSETHPAVPIINGLFDVILGTRALLPDSVFCGEDRYLGITVGTDPELSPRTMFTSAPSAAFAKRVAGDLTTLPGLMLLNSPDGDSAVSISSQMFAEGLVTTIKMIEPGDDGSPIMEMRADGRTNTFTYRIIEPADDDKPVYHFMADGPAQTVTWRLAHPPERPSAEIISDGIANTIDFRLIHPPEQPAVEILSDAGNNKTTFRLVHPPEAPGAILTSDAITNAVTFRLVHPPELPIISMNGGGDGGASIYMFNPQPEPPASNPLLTLNTGGDNSASIYMFNPQPEPPAQLFGLSSNPTTGASMGFFDDAGQVMGVEPTPFNSGFSLKLFNPLPMTPAPLAEMSSTYAFDGASGKVAVYDPGAYLASELTPGNLRLQFSTGGMDGPALVLNADQTTARVGIGTDAPGFSLDMMSFGTGDGMRVNSSDGSQLFRIRENSDGSCETQISDLTGSTKVMIRANGSTYFAGGNVGIGVSSPTNILEVQLGSATDPIADAWTVHSSRRWKDNIKPLEGALDKVERLRGVSFDWLSNKRHDIGMIAEEVGEVVPEVVAYEENGTDAKSIDYNRLTAVLVEAIKELKQENENLKTRIEALERQ